MCGRFALTLPRQAVVRLFSAQDRLGGGAEDRPRHNIRPTQQIWVCARQDMGDGPVRILTAMRWGFVPHWSKTPNDGPLLINARAETIADKPAFQTSARERRCLVPADGFYEWRAAAGRGKEPHWVASAKGAPLVFAGVWRTFTHRPEGADADVSINTAAIVTCAANDHMAPLHERLPVVIAPEHFGLWLGEEGKGAARLMKAPPDDFYHHHMVSTRLNQGGAAAPDDPGLREPAPLDQAAETLDLGLFADRSGGLGSEPRD